MKIGVRHWLSGLLGLCAVVTIGLLVWPSASARPLPRPAADHYRGPNIEMRRAGPVSKFPLRLASPNAPAAPPDAIEAVPVLVGVAGRRAYLRSTVTGEVEGVTVGASVDGWRLVSVKRRAAILRGSDGDKRVEMFAAAPVAPEPAPTGGPPSPISLSVSVPPSTGG
ncbi:hypothetical protein BrevBR_15445 [Brevundimonas sp. BR2-1]|uniref:hypothetical protein n=1 Tax=Brevundimonas sp. BR2-1 TaxID=3031123 RepID=UPI0030985DFE